MIDWVTVAAQIVNFLILVALLKYFLYGRIVGAMEQREAAIAAEWREVESKQNELDQEVQAAQDKNRDLEQQREAMLARVRDEAEDYRKELTAEVRREADETKSRWAESIREETDSFLEELRGRVSEQFLTLARKALAELSDETLERRIVDSFLAHLERLSDKDVVDIRKTLAEGRRHALIQTAFDLPEDDRERIRAGLEHRFGAGFDLRFERSDDLICGIAFHSDAHKVAWSLGDYLLSLEEEIRRTLTEEADDLQAGSEASATSGTH